MSSSQLTADSRPPADPDSWCWSWDGALESVQDARKLTRGQAINRYCADTGDWFPAVRAWKRHARALTRLDNWIWWVESTEEAWDAHPDEPPADWKPDPWNEDMPVWELCRPDDEGAVPIWVCAPKDCKPPHRPKARAAA